MQWIKGGFYTFAIVPKTIKVSMTRKRHTTGRVSNMSGYRYVSDCRSRGWELDPGPVPYFCGD